MSVSLLIITHDTIAQCLLDTTKNIMGFSLPPIDYKILNVTNNINIDQTILQAKQLCNTFKKKSDILIVTDMYGSTPSNIAIKLSQQLPKHKTLILTGINLPMLITIMNHAHLNLKKLAKKACLSAGKSIFIIDKK